MARTRLGPLGKFLSETFYVYIEPDNKKRADKKAEKWGSVSNYINSLIARDHNDMKSFARSKQAAFFAGMTKEEYTAWKKKNGIGKKKAKGKKQARKKAKAAKKTKRSKPSRKAKAATKSSRKSPQRTSQKASSKKSTPKKKLSATKRKVKSSPKKARPSTGLKKNFHPFGKDSKKKLSPKRKRELTVNHVAKVAETIAKAVAPTPEATA